jgi:FkbM family methyltransferase
MKRLTRVLIIFSGLLIAVLGVISYFLPGSLGRYFDYKTTGAVIMRAGQYIYPNSQDSTITPFLIGAGLWEGEETALALALLEAGETVVDVGANVGYYTIVLSRKVGPGGKVYAFEPEPTNFDLLMKGVSANGLTNVTAEQLALSDSRGSLTLYLASENKGDHRIAPAAESRESIEIEAIPLDEYLPPGTPVNFVKVDTQGAEGVILAGMERVLGDNTDIVLVIEFWPEGLQRIGGSAEQVLADLAALGFDEVFEISEDDRGVRQTSAGELLSQYTVENQGQTNLVFPKGKMRARMAGRVQVGHGDSELRAGDSRE